MNKIMAFVLGIYFLMGLVFPANVLPDEKEDNDFYQGTVFTPVG